MRITIIAVGKLKRSAETDLVSDYGQRLDRIGRAMGLGPLQTIEIEESRLPDAAQRVSAEGDAIRRRIPENAAVVALDGSGKNLTSGDFAARLSDWRDSGLDDCVCLIGGPDGLDLDLLGSASQVLALGRATWPHRLVRIMLAEQLYRAATILANHPYHRGGRP